MIAAAYVFCLFLFSNIGIERLNYTTSYLHCIRLQNVQLSLVCWTLADQTKKKSCPNSCSAQTV